MVRLDISSTELRERVRQDAYSLPGACAGGGLYPRASTLR